MIGKIYINGVIGSTEDDRGVIIEKGVELVDVISQVKKYPNAEAFELYINSPGGYIDVGQEIYDYLSTIDKPITSIGVGMVASMATVIFMVGQKRIRRPNTKFMIHLPQGGIMGSSRDIAEYSAMMGKLEKYAIDFYSEKTRLTKEEVSSIVQTETFLTDEQTLRLGFTTEKTEGLRAVAKLKTNMKNESIWAKMKKILDLPVTNKTVYDTASTEIIFPDVEDSAEVKVGDTATVDGQPAEGSYTIPSPEDSDVVLTYVFTDGELVEIQGLDDGTEEEVEEEEMLKMVAELKTELDTLKAENEALKDESEKLKADTEKMEKLEEEHQTMKLAFEKLVGYEPPAPKNRQKQKTPEAKDTAKTRLSNAILKLKDKK